MTYTELVTSILRLGYSVRLINPDTISSTLIVSDSDDYELASVSFSIPGQFSLRGESPYELDNIIIKFSQTPLDRRSRKLEK